MVRVSVEVHGPHGLREGAGVLPGERAIDHPPWQHQAGAVPLSAGPKSVDKSGARLKLKR